MSPFRTQAWDPRLSLLTPRLALGLACERAMTDVAAAVIYARQAQAAAALAMDFQTAEAAEALLAALA